MSMTITLLARRTCRRSLGADGAQNIHWVDPLSRRVAVISDPTEPRIPLCCAAAIIQLSISD
jgi:hypothetical protein